MPKKHKVKSNLSIDKAPIIKKKEDDKPKKLGLIARQKMKNFTVRLPLDVIEDIKAVSKDASNKTNMSIKPPHAISIVFRHLKKRPAMLLKMIKS